MAAVGRPNAEVKIGVADDAEEPRGEAGFVPERVEVLVQPQEYLSRDVPGLFVVAAERVGEFINGLSRTFG